MAKVGWCLIVAEAFPNDGPLTNNSVEVLDVQREIVWSLPNLTVWWQYGCSMVTLSDCVLAL